MKKINYICSLELILNISYLFSMITSAKIVKNKLDDLRNHNSSFQLLEKIKLRASKFYESLPETLVEDGYLTMAQLVKKYGYPIESHNVRTEDGYLLTLFRIPHGRGTNGSNGKNKKVMFLQHGLLMSSVDWTLLGPGKALAYILADEGYDVWLGNARGNKYSRHHVKMNPSSANFWQFSWHEIAIYDMPAMIDYVLKKTGEEKIFYVGHSQGTTVTYVLLSQKPEYNDKFYALFHIAPVAYMTHMVSPLSRSFSTASQQLELLSEILGVNEFVPNQQFLQAQIGDILCRDDSVTQILCTNAVFSLMGYSKNEFNTSLLPAVMGHDPAGSSVRQLLHYGQEVQSGKFCMYDHGFVGNLRLYNSAAPKSYDLSKVIAPIYIFYSKNDWFSHELDAIRTSRELGNCREKILVDNGGFNHIDYLFGYKAPLLVYNRIIAISRRH